MQLCSYAVMQLCSCAVRFDLCLIGLLIFISLTVLVIFKGKFKFVKKSNVYLKLNISYEEILNS